MIVPSTRSVRKSSSPFSFHSDFGDERTSSVYLLELAYLEPLLSELDLIEDTYFTFHFEQ